MKTVDTKQYRPRRKDQHFQAFVGQMKLISLYEQRFASKWET